jgi:hypothetical protein
LKKSCPRRPSSCQMYHTTQWNACSSCTTLMNSSTFCNVMPSTQHSRLLHSNCLWSSRLTKHSNVGWFESSSRWFIFVFFFLSRCCRCFFLFMRFILVLSFLLLLAITAAIIFTTRRHCQCCRRRCHRHMVMSDKKNGICVHHFKFHICNGQRHACRGMVVVVVEEEECWYSGDVWQPSREWQDWYRLFFLGSQFCYPPFTVTVMMPSFVRQKAI